MARTRSEYHRVGNEAGVNSGDQGGPPGLCGYSAAMGSGLIATDVDFERNLRLIPIHQAMAGLLVWLPVLVLYTTARFGLDGAVLLSALYYLFVVAFELPSGWMSDRFGRVLTLRIAAGCWVLAHTIFYFGDDRFAWFVVGEMLVAGGFACLSGTDVSFHYDTLETTGKVDEYTWRQSRVATVGFVATAVGSVLGGLLGLIELRLIFVASFVFAVGQLVVASRFVEPSGASLAKPLVGQLRACWAYRRDRYLGWIFLYGVVLVTLEHLPVTLLQPWLTELLGRTADDVGITPLVSGVLLGVVFFVGAGAARLVGPVSQRFGVVATLLGLAVLSAVIVTGMAVWVHGLVVVLVLFRSAQGSAAPVLISQAVASRVGRGQRATFLSLDSLAGRLGFGLVLVYLHGPAARWGLATVLAWFSILAWVSVGILVTSAIFLRRQAATNSA